MGCLFYCKLSALQVKVWAYLRAALPSRIKYPNVPARFREEKRAGTKAEYPREHLLFFFFLVVFNLRIHSRRRRNLEDCRGRWVVCGTTGYAGGLQATRQPGSSCGGWVLSGRRVGVIGWQACIPAAQNVMLEVRDPQPRREKKQKEKKRKKKDRSLRNGVRRARTPRLLEHTGAPDNSPDDGMTWAGIKKKKFKKNTL